MSRLRLDRKHLASLFKNDFTAVVAFERALGLLELTPDSLDELQGQGSTAQAATNQLAASVALLADLLEGLAAQPVALGEQAEDAYMPPTVPFTAVTLAPVATDLATAITLVNSIRDALIVNGIGA